MTRFSETPPIYLRSSTSFSERASIRLIFSSVLTDPDLNLMGSTTPQRSRCTVKIVGYYCSRTYANSLLLANLESWFSITTLSTSFPPQKITVCSLIYVVMRSYKKLRISQKMCLQRAKYWGLLSICRQPINEIPQILLIFWDFVYPERYYTL
jgi:hypothetical protein